MSMHYFFYTGVYIKCFFHYEEKIISKVGCPKCKVEKRFLGKYCAMCGTSIDKFEIKEKKKSIIWKEKRELANIFYDTGVIEYKNFDILFCFFGKGFKFDNSSYSNNSYSFPVNFSTFDIKKEINLFEKKYEKEINILSKFYDKVFIEWGILKIIN